MKIDSREDANRVLENGIVWGADEHLCELVDGTCFKLCQMCTCLGHDQFCCKNHSICDICGKNHPKLERPACSRSCVSCGSEGHSSGDQFCDIVMRYRDENRFPTMQGLALAVGHSQLARTGISGGRDLSSEYGFTIKGRDLEFPPL